MRSFWILLAALVVCGCAMACQTIGYGNYYYIGTQLLSSGGGSRFLSPPEAMFDNNPATQARMTWTSGPQGADSYTSIKINLTDTPDGGSPVNVPVGLIGISNTSLPAGMTVEVYQDTITLVASGQLTVDPRGGTSVWAQFDNRDASVFELRFVRGRSAMTADEEFAVGGIFAGARADAP